MALLNEYAEIIDIMADKKIKVYLPDVVDFYAVDNREFDGEDEITEDYGKFDMKDGSSFIFRCPLAFAIELQKNIMRFKIAEAIGLRTKKIFVY